MNKEILLHLFLGLSFTIFISDLYAKEKKMPKAYRPRSVLKPIQNTRPVLLELLEEGDSGLKVLSAKTREPDENMHLGLFEMRLPELKEGIFTTQDDNYMPWPVGANRGYQNRFTGGFEGLTYRSGGIFLLAKTVSDEYLAIVPIGGDSAISWLEACDDGKLRIGLSSLGTAPVVGALPLVAWAKNANMYSACRQAWAQVLAHPELSDNLKARSAKTYPEMFKYLGWCSWEEYKKNIDEKVLVSAVRNILDSKLPIRYVLIDDGHQMRHPKTGKHDQLLRSFAPDTKLFPNGWETLLELREPRRIRWMGLWHCNDGLWGGYTRPNDFGFLDNDLMKKGSRWVIKPDSDAQKRFYDNYIGSVKKHGFDFVKIDNQAKMLYLYAGTANAVQTAAQDAIALQAAVEKHQKGVINCMAQNLVAICHTGSSNVTRCSSDYKVGNMSKARLHVWQSYFNTLWLGQTVWCDHDMFHSCDRFAGRLMAVSKAMSGGPTYLSDAPEDFIDEYIMPLSYADGKLIRPIAPAVPMTDSALIDPMAQRKPYRVIAPLKGGSAAVVAYNLYDTKDTVTTQSSVCAKDFTEAAGMIQPFKGNWTPPAEGLIVYDWYSQSGQKLKSPYQFKLKGLSDRLLLLCPVQSGWAAIGRTDKYLSPATVEILNVSLNQLKIRLVESGPFAIWSANGEPKCNGISFQNIGNGLWKASVPVKECPRDFIITRN